MFEIRRYLQSFFVHFFSKLRDQFLTGKQAWKIGQIDNYSRKIGLVLFITQISNRGHQAGDVLFVFVGQRLGVFYNRVDSHFGSSGL